jgi:hypothetical protein
MTRPKPGQFREDRARRPHGGRRLRCRVATGRKLVSCHGSREPWQAHIRDVGSDEIRHRLPSDQEGP